MPANDLEAELLPILEHRRPPMTGAPPTCLGRECPKGFASLLAVANGFITKGRLFRVFGTDADPLVPSLEAWNASEWKAAYGHVADVFIVAEDIFGDQYGYRFEPKRQLVKLWCEGGEGEALEGGINWLIGAFFDPFGSGALDEAILEAALQRGLQPQANEHLAYTLPLVTGGDRTADNLSVESAALHLGTVSQLTRANRGHQDGSAISRFRSER